MKKVWIWVSCIVLAVIILFTLCFWDSLVIYSAPQMVLSQALSDTLQQLDVRFRYNPVRNCLDNFSLEGRYAATVALETEIQNLGPVACDLQVLSDAVSHQAQIDGSIHSGDSKLNLSLHISDRFAALSSQELVDGKYYGITYDTFLKDMERFPLAKLVIPKATIINWNSDLKSIQQMMSRPYIAPRVSEEDIRLLVAGILLLDAEVSDETIDGFDCVQITYSASGEEVRNLLSNVMSTDISQTASIRASFYLYEKKLLRMDLNCVAGYNSLRCTLHLGEQCQVDDLRFTIDRVENGVTSSNSVIVRTVSSDTIYQETIWFSGDFKHEASYSWDSNNGDMTFSWDNAMPIRLNLSQTDEGLRIVTDDFAQLFALLTHGVVKSNREVAAVMTLKPGQAIVSPEFINLDRWSYEDFLALLKGLGRWLDLSF